MWQMTWMLSFLPDWFWTFMFIAGILAVIAAWLLKRIPFVSRYQLFFKLGGIVSILISAWFLGAASNEERHRAEIEEMQQKVEAAQAAAAATTRAIETKVEVQTKIVREKGKDIVKYVDREVVKKEEIIKYIEQCPVPKEIIDLHNQAAELNKAAEGKK